jgi:hypothetical protein
MTMVTGRVGKLSAAAALAKAISPASADKIVFFIETST